jgi:DNA-directed RNA polymerase specialized sigma24 family protein
MAIAPGDDDTEERIRHRILLLAVLWDVEQRLEALPPHLHEALRLRYENELTDRTAAEQLGIRHSTLQKRTRAAEHTLLYLLQPAPRPCRRARVWNSQHDRHPEPLSARSPKIDVKIS